MDLAEIEAELLRELDKLASDETILIDSEETLSDLYLSIDSNKDGIKNSEKIFKSIHDDYMHDKCHSSTYFSWIDSVAIDHDSDVDLLASLKDEIELEAQEEQRRIQNRRIQSKRKRQLQASIERVNCLHLSQSASRLQVVIRCFLSQRRTAKIQMLRRAILNLVRTTEFIPKRRFLHKWNDFRLHENALLRISSWLQRKRTYRLLQTVSMTHALSKIKKIIINRVLANSFQCWFAKIEFLRHQESLTQSRLKSAVIIQSIMRRKLGCKIMIQKVLLKRTHAAIIIQSHHRGRNSRILRDVIILSIKNKESEAAHRIQTFLRSKLTRNRYIEVLKNISGDRHEIDDAFNRESDDVDLILDDLNDLIHREGDDEVYWRPQFPQVRLQHPDDYVSPPTSSSNVKEKSWEEWNMSEKVYHVRNIHRFQVHIIIWIEITVNFIFTTYYSHSC